MRQGRGDRDRVLLASGLHVSTDPNLAILRALECIHLYQVCYFSPLWTPSVAELPPPIRREGVGEGDEEEDMSPSCDPSPVSDPGHNDDGNAIVQVSDKGGVQVQSIADLLLSLISAKAEDGGSTVQELTQHILSRELSGACTAEEVESSLAQVLWRVPFSKYIVPSHHRTSPENLFLLPYVYVCFATPS
ncbi:unnamed protein product [Choristocarpus tenellus]